MDPNQQIMDELIVTLNPKEQENKEKKIQNQIWQRQANMFFPTEVSDQIVDIPVGIYKLEYNPKIGFYLVRTQDKFDFSYKIYGTENEFIDRVIKTYGNTTGNLGILLSGVKGTGKTVTAEIICNKLELPVIIVNSSFSQQGGINSFLNNVKQDIIVFFDEYEKTFPNYDHSILSVMDGVLNNGYRRVWLLTTNDTWVNSNMLQRPGRIRYLKSFEDLSLVAINEIIDDMLVYKEFKNELIDFVSTLEIITVDIVKAIVEEINIHKQPPNVFADIFNVKPTKDVFNIDILEEGKWVNEYIEVRLNFKEFSNNHIHQRLTINGIIVGTIYTVISKDTIVVNLLENEDEGIEAETVTYKIIAKETKHKSFSPWII